MIEYRIANYVDYKAIATLHANSWRRHYKGIFRKEYLNEQVYNDRLKVWKSRMEEASNDQYVFLASHQNNLCGFSCVYSDHDPQWGAFLDNLHVMDEYQGQGIGKALLLGSVAWIRKQYPDAGFYLWVLEKNIKAQRFYDKLGARREETTIFDNPGGGQSEIVRYSWASIQDLNPE